MCGKQEGLAYPVVLLVSVLFSFFLTYQIQLFLSEKLLFRESKVILQQEYYMHSSIKKVEEGLVNNSIPIGTGKFSFKKGIVLYKVETYSSDLLRITFTVKLNTLEEANGFSFYDKNQKLMVKWVEKTR